MRDRFHVSFEILHLITTISLRFNVIFEQCGLSREKMYALSYIRDFGKEYSLNGKKIEIFQRSRLIKIIMEVFQCDRTKTNNLVNEMKKADLVRLHQLSSHEKPSYYTDGQNDTLYLTGAGIEKLSQVNRELTQLLNELLKGDTKLLLPPDAAKLGFVAGKILWLLKLLVRSAGQASNA